MKRLVNRKGLTVLGVVALAIVLITAVTMSVSNGREGFFGRTVAAVTKPARSFFSQIADNLERLYGYMYKYDQLAEENDLDPVKAVKLASLVDDYMDYQQEYLESKGLVGWDDE